MKVEINKFNEGLEKTFNVDGNTFAISQAGEDYNGTLVLWVEKDSDFREWHFCCYEDGSENYCDRDEALDRLVGYATDPYWLKQL